ncbi:prolyl oligopeptidase family serine peptidase [Planococcus salinarum]|uniref:prolyl oligopeptidase family serine peptidase n=1 Tax=Planococcus salinarum TaxID=622695 RepID=UPI000E3CC864|nr:prolyl oligopeptidase family serine peptidase [Planococcus salinarum]TAA73186.1 esterase [Planococcus salinarum]
MRIQKEVWHDIPLLHVFPEGAADKKLPAVIFLHGHMSAKEHNLHYAYQLADKGLRVFLPDAHLHGEREEGQDAIQLSLRFWEIVLTSIEEIGIIHKIAQSKQLVDGEPAVAGTSMGGITTLGALTVYPWIPSAAVMMGAANYVELATAQMTQFESRGFTLPITDEERTNMLGTLAQFDGTKKLERFNKRPILFWHGEQDIIVPFGPTYNFYKQLKAAYGDAEEKLKFIREQETGHAVSRPGMLAATEWLTVNLRK